MRAVKTKLSFTSIHNEIDLRSKFHPAANRVCPTYSPCWGRDATGRGATPPTTQAPRPVGTPSWQRFPAAGSRGPNAAGPGHSPAAKKPLIRNGFKGASTHAATVRNWWRQYPKAMIGVPTGEATGIVVVDVDIDAEKNIDGRGSLQDLEEQHGPLPPTLTQRPGRWLPLCRAGRDRSRRISGLADRAMREAKAGLPRGRHA